MSAATAAAAGVVPGIDELNRSISGLRDLKITQVVAVVDRLHDRGAADRLIAPLRTRLAQLRPARPLRFSRLLFLPLDPLIVPPAKWRHDDLTIPRTVLLPLAESVRDAMDGDLLGAIDAAIDGRMTDETDVVNRAGAILWPAAGRILLEAPGARSWSNTSLPEAEHPPLARAVGAVLTQAVALRALAAATRNGQAPDQRKCERLLADSAALGPKTLSRILTLGLDCLPHAGTLMRAAETATGLGQPVSRAATELAITFLLDRLDDGGPIEACSLHESGETIQRVTKLLQDLTNERPTPERRRRISEIRQAVDATCRKRFATAIDHELLEPIHAAGETGLCAESVTALEDVARGLRKLEAAARGIGSAATYDQLLKRTTAELSSEKATAGLALVDRVRMVEILAGPEQALALLDAAAPAPKSP